MPAVTHLRLVRHGEVAAEHHGTFYGCADVPLSPAGERASDRRAEQLAAERVTRVFTSPLARARRLAERVAALSGAPLVVRDDLRELDRGAWTHRRRADIEAERPGAIAGYLADPEHGNGAGGERESELCARVERALDGMAAEDPGGRLVVVAHGHVIRAVLRRVAGWDARASLARFVPYLGVVEVALGPQGGEVLALPELGTPEALRA